MAFKPHSLWIISSLHSARKSSKLSLMQTRELVSSSKSTKSSLSTAQKNQKVISRRDCRKKWILVEEPRSIISVMNSHLSIAATYSQIFCQARLFFLGMGYHVSISHESWARGQWLQRWSGCAHPVRKVSEWRYHEEERKLCQTQDCDVGMQWRQNFLLDHQGTCVSTLGTIGTKHD